MLSVRSLTGRPFLVLLKSLCKHHALLLLLFNIIWSEILVFFILKILSRVKLLTCLNVSRYWIKDESSPLIQDCVNQGCTINLLMQKQHYSRKAQDQRLEEKNLKPQLPHQQSGQHDSFPPTSSMCGERRRGGRGEGEKTSWHGRSLSLKKMGRNQNAEFGQKDRNIWKDWEKAKSTKPRPRKLQLYVKQHTDSMNILRCGALKYGDYDESQNIKTSP